jgi:hypothetical protein
MAGEYGQYGSNKVMDTFRNGGGQRSIQYGSASGFAGYLNNTMPNQGGDTASLANLFLTRAQGQQGGGQQPGGAPGGGQVNPNQQSALSALLQQMIGGGSQAGGYLNAWNL